jgi:hypothetical protein|tara:strand:- start:72 stop:839 length:768 start_codon:yes stop_codon:yes gene_type:complete
MAAVSQIRRRNTDTTNNLDAEEYATQHDLFGAISGALLVDPVRIRGDKDRGVKVAYERSEITKWLERREISPTTNEPATLNDLIPAYDIQQDIRRFVSRYPDSDIVSEWLESQPSWYTRVARSIRNAAAPAISTMSRATDFSQHGLAADVCERCCENPVMGAALAGSAIGACVGCACEFGSGGALRAAYLGEGYVGAIGTGAALGAVRAAAGAWAQRGRGKTRKRKRKKRRKTKRKTKKRKSRKKRKTRRRKRRK